MVQNSSAMIFMAATVSLLALAVNSAVAPPPQGLLVMGNNTNVSTNTNSTQKKQHQIQTLAASAMRIDSNDMHLYYLEDHCGSMADFNITEPMTFRLHRPGGPNGTQCRVLLNLRTIREHKMLITIKKIHLKAREDNGACLTQFFQITANTHSPLRLCGNLENDTKLLEPIVSSAFEVDLYYYRQDALLEEHDIEMSITFVTHADEQLGCQKNPFTGEDLFECQTDGLCIPTKLYCDGTPNCADKSDEVACPTSNVDGKNEETTEAIEVSSEPSPNPEAASGGGLVTESNNKKKHIVIGVTGGVVIIVLVAVIAIVIIRRTNNKNTDGGRPGDFSPVSSTETPAERQQPRAPAAADRDALNTSEQYRRTDTEV